VGYMVLYRGLYEQQNCGFYGPVSCSVGTAELWAAWCIAVCSEQQNCGIYGAVSWNVVTRELWVVWCCIVACRDSRTVGSMVLYRTVLLYCWCVNVYSTAVLFVCKCVMYCCTVCV
jgi:hypothetical protein